MMGSRPTRFACVLLLFTPFLKAEALAYQAPSGVHPSKVLDDGAAALDETEHDGPARFVLEQNYPNPFNPETSISFELVKGVRERVSLVIYNLLGEPVRTLVEGELGPGWHQYAWDARNQRGRRAASGLYLYRLRVGDRVQTRRMVLLK